MSERDLTPSAPGHFTHNGKTYHLEATTLCGATVDRINAAANRSRAKRACENIELAETLPEGKGKNVLLAQSMAALSSPASLNLRELTDAIKNDTVVIAACLNDMSEDCKDLAEAERVVAEGNVYELGLRIFIASGAQALGKSPVLRALLDGVQADSGGDETSTDGPSSSAIESPPENTSS